MISYEEQTKEALGIIGMYGQIDGAHHKAWVIDQVVRALTREYYDEWVAEWEGEIDENGDKEYEWDPGIAP